MIRFNCVLLSSGYSLPRFIKQPIAGQKAFKEAFFKDPKKQFMLECEAEGDPQPT
jgi:hypothetical protein